MHKTLLDLLLRRLVKPIWRRAPSIELLRRRAAMVDRRFGGGDAPSEPGLAERLSGAVSAQWIGPKQRIRDGAILYLHGGAFSVHLPETAEIARFISARLAMPRPEIDGNWIVATGSPAYSSGWTERPRPARHVPRSQVDAFDILLPADQQVRR